MTDAEKIAELERRVDRLKKGIHRNGEVPTPPITWPIMPTMGAKPRCSKCNIELGSPIGYVCPNFGSCPTRLAGFSCSTAGAPA